MAKRFTDTDKWKKPFLRTMKAPYKLLWLYILDECNHAGIWQVDFEVAQIKTGEKLNLEKALEFFEGRIFVFDGGQKWFIYDFIEFQYGDLNPLNRAHNSVLSLLNKYSIDWKIKEHVSPLQGAKDKYKDMVKDMDKDKGGAGVNLEDRKIIFESLVSQTLINEDATLVDEFFKYWAEGNGKKMRFEMETVFDISRRFGTWKRNDKKFNPVKSGPAAKIDAYTEVKNNILKKHGVTG